MGPGNHHIVNNTSTGACTQRCRGFCKVSPTATIKAVRTAQDDEEKDDSQQIVSTSVEERGKMGMKVYINRTGAIGLIYRGTFGAWKVRW